MSAKNLTEKSFETEINSGELVFVDFHAKWCGSCKMLAPKIDELAVEFAGRASVCKMDVDDAGDLVDEYSISNLPVFITFKNGEVLEKIAGARPKPTLVGMIEKQL